VEQLSRFSFLAKEHSCWYFGLKRVASCLPDTQLNASMALMAKHSGFSPFFEAIAVCLLYLFSTIIPNGSLPV